MKKINDELKKKIIEASIDGQERSRVADRFGVSVSTVCRLVKNVPGADHFHVGGVHCRRGTERWWDENR